MKSWNLSPALAHTLVRAATQRASERDSPGPLCFLIELLFHQDRLTHATRPSWGGVQCLLITFEPVGVQINHAARRTVVLDTVWTRDVEKQR